MEDTTSTADPAPQENLLDSGDQGQEGKGDFLTGQNDGNAQADPALQSNQPTPEGAASGEGDQEDPAKPLHPYMAQLPKDLWFNKSLSKFDKLEKLARGYIELEGKSGDSVRRPAEDAPQEDWDNFYKAIGVERPEKPDDYDFQKPENLPEGLQYSPEKEAAYKEVAHKLGLTKEQASALYNWQAEQLVNDVKAQQEAKVQAFEKAKQTMQEKWGDEFPTYLNYTRLGFSIASPKVQEKIKQYGLSNDPDVIEFFAQLGKANSEDTDMGVTREGGQAFKSYGQRLYGK